MPKQIHFEGLTMVLNNLNKEIRKIEGRTKKGLVEAGKLVKHLFDYVRDKDPVAEDKLTKMMFIQIQQILLEILSLLIEKKVPGE